MIIKPPEPIVPEILATTSVFLAGSIEMGAAEDWQATVETTLEDRGIDCIIYNPRRDDWDASWAQSVDNFEFHEQVLWELNAQEQADIIFMYLDPATKSPISLLELGLFHESSIIVVCPPDFYRRGNVEIVCQRYGIPMYDALGAGINRLSALIKHG